jgi:hypothetical protein
MAKESTIISQSALDGKHSQPLDCRTTNPASFRLENRSEPELIAIPFIPED